MRFLIRKDPEVPEAGSYQSVLKEYERQGILFVSAAIGQDKEEIKSIYGESRFVDITDLNEFPKQMIQLIARYL